MESLRHSFAKFFLLTAIVATGTAGAKPEAREADEKAVDASQDQDTLSYFNARKAYAPPARSPNWMKETGTPAPLSTADALVKLEERLVSLESLLGSRKARIRTTNWKWDELETFQSSLWRAMALDPAQMDDALIPPYIHPRSLTQQLASDLVRLVGSRNIAVKYGVESEFDDYVAFCRQLVLWRDEGLFRRTRLIAKRGVLEEKYVRLADRVAARAEKGIEVGVVWSEGERSNLLKALHEVKTELAALKGDGHRRPAQARSDSTTPPVRTLLWVLGPLVFFTGLVGGMILGRRGQDA